MQPLSNITHTRSKTTCTCNQYTRATKQKHIQQQCHYDNANICKQRRIFEPAAAIPQRHRTQCKQRTRQQPRFYQSPVQTPVHCTYDDTGFPTQIADVSTHQLDCASHPPGFYALKRHNTSNIIIQQRRLKTATTTTHFTHHFTNLALNNAVSRQRRSTS